VLKTIHITTFFKEVIIFVYNLTILIDYDTMYFISMFMEKLNQALEIHDGTKSFFYL